MSTVAARPTGTTLPSISVVTPSFNQAPFLRETLDSVLGQDYPNLEYVVVDGGSTDGSREIIEAHASRLTWWCSEKDGGHADAVNKGFARTTGEVMAWLNSDDKYVPWTFQVVAEVFSQFPEIEWLSGVNGHWNERGHQTYARPAYLNRLDYLSGHYTWIQQESVFWRRSLWERAGGALNTSFKLMVDGELWCRFLRSATLYQVNCVLGGYRLHGANRAGAQMEACHREMQAAISELRRDVPTTELLMSRGARLLRPLAANNRLIAHLGDRAMRLAFRSQVREASYPVVDWCDGKWVLKHVPYSLYQRTRTPRG